jgi:hypothetical protein
LPERHHKIEFAKPAPKVSCDQLKTFALQKLQRPLLGIVAC